MDSKSFMLFVFSLLSSYVESDYIAAVVEHVPLETGTPSQTLETNLQGYRDFLGVAKRSNVDIIVFPEYGLTGLIDDPTNYSIYIPDVGTARGNYTEFVLLSLSEAAVEHAMYIVINIAEKAKDEKNRTVHFNTNIVFDKTGRIAAKYRKINLYDEDKFTPGTIGDIEKAVFTTDFGRTFGTFICFDILFHNPSRQILNLNRTTVTDIVYPTAWYSIMPFYHSLSVQQAYAAENKVNLLSANINNVKEGQGGSGIYGADGTVYRYYLSGKPSSQILISTVKTSPSLQGLFLPDANGSNKENEEMNNYITPYYFRASDYKFKLVDLSKGNISERVCDGPFCCDFVLNLTASSTHTSTAIYQLMAYRGPLLLGPGVYGPSEICFIMACQLKDPKSCGTRNVTNTTTFRQLLVRTAVGDDRKLYYAPISLTTSLLPVFNSSYEFVNIDGRQTVELLNTQMQDKVLVFGIYSNGVDQLSVSRSLIIVLFVALFKYFLN